ncbi:hypothetical protein ACWZHB_33005 [Nocardia sp. FBN12]|uniref:hypothetical protein n=1 Tax=Nocardia sp. FBN12 TaxID=3419766 RepID=UPI003D07DC3B
MSDFLSVDSDTVRAQGGKLQATAQELTAVAGLWGNMFAAGDLGEEYAAEAQEIVTGFEKTVAAVKNWSQACTAFGDALTNSANSLQYTDTQFSDAIGKVSVDNTGNLITGGK